MQVELEIISDAQCETMYLSSYFDGIRETLEMCTLDLEGEVDQDHCVGDDGGPLVILQGPASDVQVGIISWGGGFEQDGCANPQFPGVYQEISSYKTWIDTTLSENSDSSPDAPSAATTMMLSSLFVIVEMFLALIA